MAITQFGVYQEALRLLGDVRLATLTDNVEARYALDDAWKGAVPFVLRQAPWRFALKTAALAEGGTALPGYGTAYAQPADWLRTHAIFLAVSGRECPIDLREQGATVSVNVATAPTERYVSDEFADPAFAPWPTQFAQCVAAYLAFLAAARVTGSPAAASQMSQLFGSLLPQAAAIDAVAEDLWLPHQRSGNFLRIARTMIDEGFWRFALKTALIDQRTGAGDGGLANAFAQPADFARTRSLYVLAADGRRCPFDVREVGGAWHTNLASFYAQYISATLAMDTTQWPDHYLRAVLRQLQFDDATRADREGTPPTYGRDYQQRADTAWQEALADTLDSEADAPDPFLARQLDGSFIRAARAALMAGYWRFALVTADVQGGALGAGTPASGFPYCAPLPADWVKTHAAFRAFGPRECPIDVREDGAQWSAAVPAWTVRYLSATLGLDATRWPEPFARYVQTLLEYDEEGEAPNATEPDGKRGPQLQLAAWQKALADALGQCSEVENPWWRFQRDGRFREAVQLVLEQGMWKFAIKTIVMNATITMDPVVAGQSIFPSGNTGTISNAGGTVTSIEIPTSQGPGTLSPGYRNAFPKPPDLLRTVWIYRNLATEGTILGIDVGSDWIDVDFRDEGGLFHANWTPLTLRYVSRQGFDSTRWPAAFATAVLAWCEYGEVRSDPKAAGVAAAKLKLYQAQLETAEAKDDEKERPPVRNTGRFVRARFGRGTGFNLEEAMGY